MGGDDPGKVSRERYFMFVLEGGIQGAEQLPLSEQLSRACVTTGEVQLKRISLAGFQLAIHIGGDVFVPALLCVSDHRANECVKELIAGNAALKELLAHDLARAK
jgi:hypothetical protein